MAMVIREPLSWVVGPVELEPVGELPEAPPVALGAELSEDGGGAGAAFIILVSNSSLVLS